MTLGEKIEKLRQDKHLSQKELASTLNKKTVDVALWESNEAVPSISDITKLSSALDVTVDYLINDVDIGNDDSGEKNQSKAENNESNTETIHQKENPKSKKKWILILCIIALIIIGVIIGVIASISSKPFSKDGDAIEKAASSVVKILCYDYDGNESATGSGFVSFDNQTVVTNYHVMEEAYTCKISTDQDKTLEVESIVNYSKENDIALLKLKGYSELDALEIGDSNIIKKGETVTAIGSPLGIKNTVSQGVLSGRVMQDSIDVLQFTAEISAGSSGGALFNERGEVIGVTYSSFENGQNLNLAIPIEIATELYNTKEKSYDISTIYLEKYPYSKYMNEYKSVDTVTISELKTNPIKYNGKTIRITAYVSSTDNIYREGDVRFVTDYDDSISGDYYADSSLHLHSDFENTDVLCVNNGKDLYIEDKLSAGDYVCIIGTFEYFSKGTIIDALPNHPLTRECNMGDISTDILYRIDVERLNKK